jgi:hypothetical protein
MSVNCLHNVPFAQQAVDLLLKIGIFKYLPQEMPEITHFVGRCPIIGLLTGFINTVKKSRRGQYGGNQPLSLVFDP